MGRAFSWLLVLAGLLAFAMLLSLFLIKIGWSWFMVPVFGIRDIGWVEAFGLALLANAFKTHRSSKS